MAGGDVDEDGSLAEDMMNVEALLGLNVVQRVTDNLILDLLRAYSSDRNRVQKVVRKLQGTYLKDNFALLSDEDDNELLALESPYLSFPGTSDAKVGSIPRSKDSVATSSSAHTIISTSSYNSGGGNGPVNTREEPVLQPAKLNISAALRGNGHFVRSRGTCSSSIQSASLNQPIVGSFANHRKAQHVKNSDESSSTSAEEDSEPEVLSIHEEDRKRKKICGNKSPGKKTRVEIVDLVNSSPKSSLNYEDYLGILEAMFPDADPHFLMRKFQHIENEQELNVVASALLESNNYPRIGAGAVNVGGERESTMNISNASVIIKPSAFEVPRTSELQPSTSSSVHISNKNSVMSEPEERGSQEDLTLEDILSAAGAAEVINSLPQSGGTAVESSGAVKYPSSLVSDKSADASQHIASTSNEVTIQKSVSPAVSGLPKQEILDCLSPPLAQIATVPKNLLPSLRDLPTSSALSHKPNHTLPTSETLSFPSSHVKDTPLPPFSVRNDGVICSEDEPGPSHRNEKPWVEKYSFLLSLFPQSDQKFLKSQAKLLHDNDIDFNLFVETTLENMQNPPNNPRNDVQGCPVNPPELVNVDFEEPRVNVPHSDSAKCPEHRITDTSGIKAIKVPKTNSVTIKRPIKVDVPQPNSSNVPEPGKANVPSVQGPNDANEPGPSTNSVAGASSTHGPGPIATNVAGPSGLNNPGPSGLNNPGSSGLSTPGPSGLNNPGPSSLNVPGPSSMDDDVSEGNPWSDKYSFLLSILPDADPTFLEEKAKALYDKDEDLKTFVANALENKDYPTLKDYQRRQEIIALQNKYLNDFNIENFLDIVPEPFKYFSQTNRKPSLDSRERGLLFLKRKYRKIRSNDITATYKKHQYNLTNTCHELNRFQGVPLKSRRPDFVIADKLPDSNISLQFLQEVAFIENEDKIKKYLEDKEAEEERALKEARDEGELLECNCCFDDEVLARNIVTCPEGHIFCKSCVRKGAETKIGDGETVVSCLTDCQAEFTLQSLQGVLKPTVFSKLAQRKQLEEIKAAGIEDLVQCPFCNFCNIPGSGDKIFRCLNPDCMKDSCIMCKEESHIPLRCDEVEKASEVKMRTYIEDKMTEALVRTCWKCQRKFVKIDGCNKMTCQCGALMCYICRQPVKDYTHFNGQGGDAYHKCPLFSDNNALHVDAVERVAAEAKAELAQKHPGVALKHDPTSVPIPREAGGRRPGLPLPVEGLPWDQLGRHPVPHVHGANRLPPQYVPLPLYAALPRVDPPAVAAQAAAPVREYLYGAAAVNYPGAPFAYLHPPPIAPARRPNPVPVHRCNTVPPHRPNPVQAHRPDPVPAYRPNPVQVHRPNPLPPHRQARNANGELRNRHAAYERMLDLRHVAADIRNLAANLRREGEQLAANPGHQLRRGNAGLAYQAELARPAYPTVPPPVGAAAPNGNALFAQNMIYNRHPYQPNPN